MTNENDFYALYGYDVDDVVKHVDWASGLSHVALIKWCPFCQKTSAILVYEHEFDDWQDGKYAQDVWPHLTAGEREQIISGAHEACFDAAFIDDEEEGG